MIQELLLKFFHFSIVCASVPLHELLILQSSIFLDAPREETSLAVHSTCQASLCEPGTPAFPGEVGRSHPFRLRDKLPWAPGAPQKSASELLYFKHQLLNHMVVTLNQTSSMYQLNQGSRQFVSTRVTTCSPGSAAAIPGLTTARKQYPGDSGL